jgi:hypothetical protein
VSGWPAVGLIIVAQIAAAAFLIRLAVARWWEYLVIAALTAALVRATELYVTGDISRYLPDAIWSGGAEGKDQVIYVSAASTILLPLMVSALAVYVFRQVLRASGGSDERRAG